MISRRFLLSGLLLSPLLAAEARAGQAAASVPQRIVCLDWAAAETLLALGVVPIAIADKRRFADWFRHVGLPEGVVDCGAPNEPNLELLQSLSPDLIFLPSWGGFNRDVLARIAPVHTIAIYTGARRPLAASIQVFREIADLTGRRQEAESYLSGLERVFDEGRLMVARSPAAARPVYIAVLSEDARHATVYGKGSLVQDVLDRLGIVNAWTMAPSLYGNTMAGIEVFADEPEARLLYLDQGDRTERALVALSDSSLWQALPVVRFRRLSPIAAFYPSAGLPTALQLSRLLADAVAADGKT